jgi:serine/threonine protein kinase
MLSPDDALQNRYRIVRRLGHGGMGAVYEAIDRRVKATVALKETFATTEEGRKAFRLEAERLANLDHEVFPKVSDYFEEGEGLYLVMQLIRGEDLEERLRERLRYYEGPFSLTKVLEWADQLLDALEELHKYRPPIIHRDIKPSNLKLTQRGKIILLDFGIAKGAAGQMSTLRTDGSIGAATPYFAPLEQVLRIDQSSVKTLSTISRESVEKFLHQGTDPRSDLYSLGATLYRLMTGEVPDDARLRAMAIWAGRLDPLQPAHEVNPQVSQSVSNVLMQAMALERSDRPADAVTMRRMLREAVGTPVHIPPTISPPEDLDRQRREEEARQRAEAEAENERLRLEEEEQQRAEEELRQREAKAQRERESQEAARRAEEERQRQEAEIRERAEEERRRKEGEERGKLEAEEAARRAEEKRQRVEQERSLHEAKEAERERAAEHEKKERAAAAQQAAALTTQRAQDSTPSNTLAVKTIKAPPPERVALSDAESPSSVVAPANRNRRAMWITMLALVILAVVVSVVVMRRGESNSNQSPGGNQTQTGQGASVPSSNSNSAAAQSPVESTRPQANEPERNTQSQTPIETDNANRASAPNNTGHLPPSVSNSAANTRQAQERDAAERRKRALDILDQP